MRGGCKATIAANYTGERLVDGSSGNLAHTGESHGVAMAPNGWAIYIGRADCRTDAERGAMIGQASSPRILDFANRNVGVGCGNVHILDPAAANGTVNSGVTRAGVLPVYGDRGSGNEINGKIEAGLLGIAVSPDFARPGTSTCSTSRPSTRTTRSTRAWPTATSAGSRRWASRASRASRSTSRPSS